MKHFSEHNKAKGWDDVLSLNTGGDNSEQYGTKKTM